MTTATKPKPMIIRCLEFFGLKDGQSKQDFAHEYNALSMTEKRQLQAMFNEAGMPTAEPQERKDLEGSEG